jgi:beta-glucanase (GH16 family)
VVETNYFGKGNTTTYNRATYEAVDDPQDNWHIYTIDWTSEYVKWYVDGALVRTLLYADALDGKNFPQTPMRIKIGNWDGGAADEAEGTVEWAGGYTDLDDAPFIMYVKNVTIEDYTTNGTTYTYGDMTGSYTSIVIGDNSTSSNTSYTGGSSVGTSNSSSTSTSSSANSSTTSSSNSSTSSAAVTSGARIGGQSGSFLMGLMCLGFAYLYL